MVKNLPTVERSTKIRFGKYATDDQAENTIVFNASNVAINANTPGSMYMTPLRVADIGGATFIGYNSESKEIVNTGVLTSLLGGITLESASLEGNTISNSIPHFANITTAFTTIHGSNVGISNTNPQHMLSVGDKIFMSNTGAEYLKVEGNVRVENLYAGSSISLNSTATNKIQVSGRINTDSITLSHIGISNTNPTITGLSLGSSTFLQNPTDSINAFSTTGNVSASFYHGDSYFLSNLKLDNIVLQGNTTASKTVEFNYANGPALITNGNVGIQNTHGIHTLDVGSNLFVDDKGSNILVVTGNTYTSRKALVGSNLIMDTFGSNVIEVTGNTFTSRKVLVGSNVTIDTLATNVVEVTGNTFTSRKALIGSNVTIDTLATNVVEVTGNTYTSRKALVGSNVTIDTLATNVVEVTGNTYTSRKALVGSNLVMDTLGSNVVEVTGNTFTSRKALVGSNLVMDTLGSNVVEVTGNTFTSRKALVGSNLVMDTLGSNVIEVTGNTFTSRKALIGSNVTIDTLATNVIEVTGNVNVSNYTKTDYITVQKDAHIKGNLLVEGTTTTIDTVNTTFGDAIISLANNNTQTSTDIGIIMKQPNSNASPTVTFRGDEKEIMIGYTLNSSLDTEITPDSANVIDLHVYGNIIAQNNITLTSGELTAITLNGNVIGNNVDVITLTGNVIGNNVDVITLTGNVIGNNVDVITLTGNVIGNNVSAITLYGNVSGNNVDVITLTGNVIGNNVDVITLTGNVIGNNVSAITLYGNVSGDNVSAITLYGNVSGSNVDVTGNVHVGSNIFVSGIKDDDLSYIPMIEKGTGKLIRSPAHVDSDGTYIITAANAEFTGNLSFTGNTYVFESNTVVINDRILGIANNNTSHTLDVGIIMEHPGHNIAFIHHGEPSGGDPHNHEMTLGYTQNTVADNHVLDDANVITFRVLGNIIAQNNITITSGDLTAITVNSNVVGDNVSVITLNGNVSGNNVDVITLNGNVSGDNVSAITLYGNVSGNNVDVITLNGNVSGDNVSAITLYGNVSGDNVSAITLYGNVSGNNVDVITLNGNVSGDNVSAITLYGNVVSDNVVATNGMYGVIAGSNTISASTIYVGTGTPSLGDYDLRVEGDTEITGNLLVGGTTTTVNTENLVVKDPIIQLGDASASVDSGLLLARPSDNVYVGYDNSNGDFALGFTSNHAGESSITVKDNVNFTLNVHGNVEASYFFGDGSQLSGIQTATPTLASIVDEGNVTSNVVRFTNTTTGIEITSNIDFVNNIILKSSAGTVASLKVDNAIKLDPAYASPSNNVLSFNTSTGEIYDSGGQGGSTLDNIHEEGSNVAIGPSAASANLTVNTFGSNVLTVSGNVSADNITIGGLNIAASPFALDDVVSVYEGANVTANVLTLGGLVTSGNVDAGNVITTGDITISGNTTSQNIKLTNTDISATISSGTITIDAREKSYGTAPLVVSTTDVSNLIFSNLITGAQIVVPILASGGDINISKELTNVNFYAMTTDVSVTQDKHALMTLSNLYGNIYMNAIGFA